ncbi:hypothetical protein [Streptomyces sp. NPDC051183]|uniref:hypothetical protein n=1 Tax=unclassified Streptomyces TaxID=2593676 RepID=UPI003449DB3A
MAENEPEGTEAAAADNVQHADWIGPGVAPDGWVGPTAEPAEPEASDPDRQDWVGPS